MGRAKTLSLIAFLLAWPFASFADCLGIVHFAQGLEYEVEIAADAQTRSVGLMHRQEMAAHQGMLFLYPEDGERRFWMKNTYLPLDILFYRESGILNNTQLHAVPFDETPLPGFGAMILEVNEGQYRPHREFMDHMTFELTDDRDCPAFVISHPARLSAL